MSHRYVLIVREQDCAWCSRAEALLTRTGTRFVRMLDTDPVYDRTLRRLVPNHDHHTVPVFFADGEYVGGYEALSQLLGESVPRY